MFDLAREVFVCACATDVPGDDPPATRALGFRHGGSDDLARLPDHDAAALAEMQARLARGDDWLVGELDGRIVTYTFLSIARSFDYPALPGCAFALRADVGYGYGAWTPPSLRNRGYRRRAFLEELRWLRQIDKKWEAERLHRAAARSGAAQPRRRRHRRRAAVARRIWPRPPPHRRAAGPRRRRSLRAYNIV